MAIDALRAPGPSGRPLAQAADRWSGMAGFELARRAPRVGMGQTWAKTILLGEHAVVYGQPAIALPLHTLRMTARAVPISSETRLRCLDYDGPLDRAPEPLSCIVRAVHVALDFADRPEARLAISTRSDFPPERGLGSSAASAGAVIRATLDALSVGATDRQLFELTQQAESVAHGRSSGIDAMTTAAQAPLYVDGGRAEPLPADGRLGALVVADSGIAGRTLDAVRGVRDKLRREPSARTVVEDLGRLARRAALDVVSGDAVALGRAMTAAHRLLGALAVSTRELDRLASAALAAGALGAKLTGGGLGGCVIALAASDLAAESIATAMRRAGARQAWTHSLNRRAAEPEAA